LANIKFDDNKLKKENKRICCQVRLYRKYMTFDRVKARIHTPCHFEMSK